MVKKIYICGCCGKHYRMELAEEESQYMDDCMIEAGWIYVGGEWYCADCVEQEA